MVYFYECLEIDDEVAVVWMYLAIALNRLNINDESEICTKRSVELDFDSLDALNCFIIIED